MPSATVLIAAMSLRISATATWWSSSGLKSRPEGLYDTDWRRLGDAATSTGAVWPRQMPRCVIAVPARTAAIRVTDSRFRRGGVRVFTAGEPVGRIDMAVFSGGQLLVRATQRWVVPQRYQGGPFGPPLYRMSL